MSAQAKPLRDVQGPGALGGGWRRSAELLYLIAVTEFKRTYHGTALGYLWSLCRPLLLFGVLYVVFTEALQFGDSVRFYPAMLLFNLVLFGFFQESTGAAVSSIVAQEGIVRKTQFPRLVIPLSVVLTAFFNISLNLVAALVFMLASGVRIGVGWLGFPLIVAALFVFTTAVSMIVSSLYPRYRDVSIIWTVLSTALFYATPVLYPLVTVPEDLRRLLAMNPLAPIFETAYVWMIDPSAAGPAEVAGGWAMLLIPVAIYAAVCAFASWIFQRQAPRIAEDL